LPVINFSYNDLCDLLGTRVPQDLLVDKVPLIGADMHATEGDEDGMSVEFFPDRPDMFSVEGVARAMRTFLHIEREPRTYPVRKGDVTLRVDGSVKDVRPFISCAVIKGVIIDEPILKALMDLQEKLHITIGRKRRKLAIGVHDLDGISPPFVYKAVDPRSVSFVPLAKSETMDMCEILERHEKGKEYAHLLEGFSKYPLIVDSKENVISFPPVINGSLTTVTTRTRDIFIDVTGNDRKVVDGALAIVATALAERGGSIETVDVVDGETRVTPDLSNQHMSISIKECNSYLGLDLSEREFTEAAWRMGLECRMEGDAVISYPATRLDIMHKVDIFEDIAIGHGFERFGGGTSFTQTIGGLTKESLASESIRDILIGLGFTEVTTLTLSNPDDEFEFSNLPNIGLTEILNPITEDHTCLRANLMPSLMRILRHNKHRDLPQRVFEVGFVLEGHRTIPHLCCMVTSSKTPFTEIKSTVESIMREMSIEHSIEPSLSRSFIQGRGAEVVIEGRPMGFFGEVSLDVLEAFEITHPVSMFEIDIRCLLKEVACSR